VINSALKSSPQDLSTHILFLFKLGYLSSYQCPKLVYFLDLWLPSFFEPPKRFLAEAIFSPAIVSIAVIAITVVGIAVISIAIVANAMIISIVAIAIAAIDGILVVVMSEHF